MSLKKRDGFYWRDDIIAACIEVHGDKYDYSQVEEKISNMKDKISIICHKLNSLGVEHGLFKQPLNRHLKGRNCPICVGKNVTLGSDEILARAKKIHGNNYEYVSVERDDENKAFIVAICHHRDENGVEHGLFKQSYMHHVHRKQGCPICRYIKSAASNRRLLSKVIDLAKKVHGNKYDYSLIKTYENDRIPYPIKCIKHNHIFLQTFNNHIKNKEGCPICGMEKSALSRRYNLQKWIDLAIKKHGDKYGYDKVHETFENKDGIVHIYCRKHKYYFKQRKANHIFGQGCPICKESKLEIEISKFLEENHIKFIRQQTFDWLVNKKNMFLDFYIPEFNVAIECQGKQHFKEGGWTTDESEYLEIEQRDKLKRALCKENNIKLIYYSNLGIDYPYRVIEDKQVLLSEIKNA